MVWYLHAAIQQYDCTQPGSTIVAGPQPVRFVRVNVTSLVPTVAVRTTYTGWQTNPGGPTGTVTSVFGRTGQIQAQAGDYSVALITGAAALFSPNFQGSPTAPTPSPGDNSNLVATTAFVQQAIAGCCGGGGGGAGVASFNGRTGTVVPATGDYIFSQVTGAAPLANPTFTGIPRADTAPVGTNSTQLATTAFVIANAGTGGGTSLQGCATSTPGNLVCDNSIQGGTGNVGLLTMPYSSAGLPTPPSGALAAIAPDATGHLFWSPGNSTAFAAIGSGGGGQGTAGVTTFNGRSGDVMPQASDYSEFFAPAGSGGVPQLGGVTIVE